MNIFLMMWAIRLDYLFYDGYTLCKSYVMWMGSGNTVTNEYE
jgi:hypothetical protein